MKRFGVISCADQEKWGFSEAIVSRYLECYKTNCDEEWVGFHARRGQVPVLEDLQKFDGFMISGSVESANDDVDWILKLQELIRSAPNLDKPPKIVGICFGHQLIAKALGGKVGFNPDKDFVLQTEVIRTSNEGVKAKAIKGLFEDGPIRAVQSHGECITELPKGAVSLGTSATCEHEIVQFTENILGIQSHPDMSTHEAETLILPSISKRYNWDSEKVDKTSASFKLEDNAKTINEISREIYK
ncbi:hypothetical protein QZH41_007862 [Actinostola sp. cb2023]|nr:hypothetical protein QZH41_007862 [Actinostola sp. cb2023]